MSVLLLSRRAGRPNRVRLPAITWLSLIVSVALVAVALLAPWLAPHDPAATSVLDALQPASPGHLLGTDSSGRDLLSRLIYGSRTTLLGPLIVVTVSTVLGTALGIVAAWRRGWVDDVIGRFFDLAFSFPAVLLALMFVAVLSPGLMTAALAVSVAYVPWLGRIVRASALREVNEPYVEALRTQGLRPVQICVRHLVPNLAPLIIAQATTSIGFAIVDLAGISYLGLGVSDQTADWGKMVANGQGSIVRGHPQESLYAGIALVITVAAFIFLGDELTSDDQERSR
jgi:peptide/nickel transport system permease protein